MSNLQSIEYKNRLKVIQEIIDFIIYNKNSSRYATKDYGIIIKIIEIKKHS